MPPLFLAALLVTGMSACKAQMKGSPRLLVGQHILTELNKQLAIAPALIGRQSQDTGHIVIFCGLFFLEEQVDFIEGLARGRAEGQSG